MKENITHIFHRIQEKLWFRPVIFCLISILGALLAHVADTTTLHEIVPDLKTESITELLNIISSSMLVIATFTVGSMISAFAAASTTATPRSFNLIITDDVSRNSLSAFIGSFIFSIVALIAVKNGYYGKAGLFTLFILTLLFFTLVILTFLRWVERISRLGRMGHTIKLIENATQIAITKRLSAPIMGGIKVDPNNRKDLKVFSEDIGYILTINRDKLQEIAESLDAIFTINALPGKFVSLDIPLLFIQFNKIEENREIDQEAIRKSFNMGDTRSFDDDPRFGSITLSEIASRALSPAINDPGTAIQIINSHVRLFSLFDQIQKTENQREEIYNRIAVPEITIDDLFEDAFRPIARDGAGNIEVMIRLQKALKSLANFKHCDMKQVALKHSMQACSRAENALTHNQDVIELKKESLFNTEP
ncbi:DUF2254 domain-containing protein [Flavobacterium sp. F-380]|uniref:DUF2254 domain-containing protein n=1 Tax=Flavobacterium kayseriense TaxID=2764714 RepID=A0ABR7JAZ9_9FLAO|nr:DUF2254 domain-containing protein [Flavobacterium kayseriense]MBC5842704.1 DUF2254 domain-containing protein [Flavobacterium kayseriense]MBC5849234.1 DUF2254 domain-containing protein [Flavobacterium kayseriense]